MPDLHVFHHTLQDPAADVALSRVLLEMVAEGYPADTLRITRPPRMIAFGKLDRLQDGFDQAVGCSRELGAEPILRLAGGRAAAFHDGCLGLAWARSEPPGTLNTRDRFDLFNLLLLDVFQDMGVDARQGEVPGEYCPGESTINARGRVKLVDSGQRSVKGASHLGAVIVCENHEQTREMLEPVYDKLDSDFDPLTCGSLIAESERASLEHTESGILARFSDHYGEICLRHDLPEGAVRRAYDLADQHRL